MMDNQLFVAAGSYEGIILGFQVNLGAANPAITLTFTERTHTASVKAVKFSGNVLLSGSSDENVHVFDVGRRRFLGALHFPEGEIGAIDTFECDEAATGVEGAPQRRTPYALVADGDQRLTVLRVRARRLAIGAVQTYKRTPKPGDARNRPQAAPFGAVATHPSGKLILAVSSSRKRLFTFSFDANATQANGKPLKLEHTLPLHREPISVRWSESGTRYALALRAARSETAQGDELRVFNVTDGRECARLRVAARLTSFEWLAGDRLVAACADGTLRVYRLTDAASASRSGETETEAEGDRLDPDAAASECECEWRVGDSRVKALSVVRGGAARRDCLITCVCSDGLISVLSAAAPDEHERQAAAAETVRLRMLCSFKSVFRFTCVTAGYVQPDRVPTRAAVDAQSEPQRASVCDDDDDAAQADAEAEVEAGTDGEAVRHSLVELATRNKQREPAGGRRRSLANRRNANERPRADAARGTAASGKQKRQKASSANRDETKKVAPPRRAEMSKLEKKVRRWAAVDHLDAAKAKAKVKSTPSGSQPEVKRQATKAKRMKTADV